MCFTGDAVTSKNRSHWHDFLSRSRCLISSLSLQAAYQPTVMLMYGIQIPPFCSGFGSLQAVHQPTVTVMYGIPLTSFPSGEGSIGYGESVPQVEAEQVVKRRNVVHNLFTFFLVIPGRLSSGCCVSGSLL